MATENNWRGCNRCSVVFFNGFPDKGTCPGNPPGPGNPGGHVAQSFNFQLSFDVPETAQAQANWRGCDKCSGLFFAGFGDAPNCPGGGIHHANSENFVLRHNVPGTPIDQPGWAGCGQCSCMFFDGFAQKGHCQGGTRGPDGLSGHVMPAGSYAFVLAHWITPVISLAEELDVNGVSNVTAFCSGFSPLNPLDLEYGYRTPADVGEATFGPVPEVQTDNEGAAAVPIAPDGRPMPATAFHITVNGTDKPTQTPATSNVLRPQVG